jgi:hypothetical protein
MQLEGVQRRGGQNENWIGDVMWQGEGKETSMQKRKCFGRFPRCMLSGWQIEMGGAMPHLSDNA